jgi:hypothetical protein
MVINQESFIPEIVSSTAIVHIKFNQFVYIIWEKNRIDHIV